jgi:hypothetical protein
MNNVDSSADGKRRSDDPAEVGAPSSRYPNAAICWGRVRGRLHVLRPHAAALSGGGHIPGVLASVFHPQPFPTRDESEISAPRLSHLSKQIMRR